MRTYLFSPDSVFWKVNREALTAFAGSRALLLELAHPLVAAGVAQHSDFRRDPLGRLYRTLRTMTDLTFGEAEAAYRAARHIHCCHQNVRGRLLEHTGPYPSGTPYRASDPLLRLWVLATVIDSVLRVYELFIAPLSNVEKRAYYRDGQLLARLLGLPPDMTPPTYEDFTTYMDSMLTSDLLTVGDEAREIVAALYAPGSLGPLARAASFVGIGLLPEQLRAAYDLAWDRKREERLQRLAAISRRARPLLPDVVCTNPRAWLAERRWRREFRRLTTPHA